MTIGSRIKKIRKELDLTQAAFAARIGSVQNSVTGYENGRRNPSQPVISLICSEFNVNEEWLKTGKGEMFKPTPTDVLDALAKEYNLSHNQYVFIEKFVNIKKETFDDLMNFFNEILKGSLSSDIMSFDSSPEKVKEMSINEKVEDYRRQLELEEKVVEKSEVSQGSA